MLKKERIFKIIEIYLNEYRGDLIEEYYGKGTKIKIHNITEVISQKSLLIEAVIVLGEIINQDVLERELAHVFLNDALGYIFPEYSVQTMIRWDA